MQRAVHGGVSWLDCGFCTRFNESNLERSSCGESVIFVSTGRCEAFGHSRH